MIGFWRLLETGFLPTDAPWDGEAAETRFLCTSRASQGQRWSDT
ncbi:hypothetical protein PJF56_16290 [Roseofilum sp. BLCC_M91]|uniref:Uncharacterized protein n=1 Tax=Roseofilum halophilum BLCC-M91 TaxID=3022259 RepID=A0ABT7BMK0_9CYAN|nr:hypothetical protein [Roseofilum halophilum]MDJ1180423.1 hypothetical protein [Roseofilum halophilum BLCC-M91]